MPEIGETLREARMRRRIDMTDVESSTKIRAKYLRALENEEWDLLPGPTFVKTFLRTYAEYLGLDSRLLVEEYRQRYERPSNIDLAPFAGTGAQGRRRRPRPRPVLGPVAVVVVGVALLVGALYLLGTWGQDETPAGPSAEEPSRPANGGESPDHSDRNREAKQKKPRRVRLRLEATGAVYVCLIDATGRQVVDEQTLQPGDRTRTFRSKSFRANFGNSGVRMRVNWRTYPVAASTDPIGYRIVPGRRPARLPDAARPDCSA